MKPFAWSWTTLSNYEICPKRCWHLNIARDVKDADSEISADGKIVHAALKERVVNGKPLPVFLRHHEKVAAKFADAPGEKHGEMKLALTREFEPCDYFAPDVWVRVYIDLVIVRDTTAGVFDWKTGKVKDDHTQLGLNAAVLSRWMPEIELFRTAYIWLKSHNLSPKNYTLSKLTDVWNNLIPRAGKIEEALKTTTFPAKENPLCNGYCPVTQCPHFRERSRE